MESTPVKVYYLGSGKLGISVLKSLIDDKRIDVCGVGSQPDRPVGRKKKITPTPLAASALSLGLEVDRIESVNTEEFLDKMRELGVEILLIVAFGQLLKAPLLALPAYGCLNVHASLLPRYRGACPINAAILNGDEETGVTFMAMDRGLDTGPIYDVQRTVIGKEENAEDLEKRLGELAAGHIGDVCWRIAREGLKATAQPEPEGPNVRKISKSDGAVDWKNSAVRLERMVRAYLPWPKVFTSIPGANGTSRTLQIVKASASRQGEQVAEPGTVIESSGRRLSVACGDGVLSLETVFPEGKREMTADAFLRGNPITVGTVLPSKG